MIGLDFVHADSVVRTFTDKTPTLLQNMGSAGGQVPCIMESEKAAGFIYNQGGQGQGLGYEEGKSPTVLTGGKTSVFVEKKSVIPLRNEVTRMKNSNGLGVGEVDGPCPTLTVQDVHSVFYEAYQHHGYRESETSGTLTTDQNSTIRGDTPLVVRTDRKAFELNQHGGYRETEINGTLRAAGGLRRRVGNAHNREYQDKGEYP